MVHSSVHRLLLLTILVGCTAPPGREAFVLRIAVWGPLGELAPTSNQSALASIAQPLVYEKLATLDADEQLKPILAARVERLSGDRIQLELQRDASFSDGTQVTDLDVVHSLESGGLRVTQSERTLIVESSQRGLPADALLLEARVFRQQEGKPIGSGPFVVAARTDAEMRLVRRVRRAGRINDVRIIAYTTPRDAFAHTLRGDANLIVDLESRWLEFFRGVPSLQVVRRAGRNADAFIFNTDLPRADRVQLVSLLGTQRVRELAYGTAECAESAEAASDEWAMPAGTALRLLSWGPFERLALAARRALGDRGGEVYHLTPEETIARMKSRDFDLVTARPIRWPRSSMALIWRTGSANNFVGYSNAAVDRAIDAGDWTAAEIALQQDPPAAFVCTRDHVAVVDVRIRNPTLGPYDLLETLPEWEVAQ